MISSPERASCACACSGRRAPSGCARWWWDRRRQRAPWRTPVRGSRRVRDERGGASMSQAAPRALDADIHRALPALDARLRQGSIAAVAARCLAEMGDGDNSALARIAALSRVMDAGVGEVDRLERQGSALLVAY